MLGTQQNSLIKEGKLVNNTLVRLTEYVCNTTANNRRYVKTRGEVGALLYNGVIHLFLRIIIILNLDVVSQSTALIGNPVNIENQMQGQAIPPVAPLSQSNNSQNNNSQSSSSRYSNNSTQSSNNFSNNNTNTKSSQIVYNRPLGASQAGEPICKDKVCSVQHCL